MHTRRLLSARQSAVLRAIATASAVRAPANAPVMPTYGATSAAAPSSRCPVQHWEGSHMWPASRLFGTSGSGDPTRWVFGCKTKRNWLDVRARYCLLCQEPVGNLGTHVGYWDHINCHSYFRLWILYPRSWSAAQILATASQDFPGVAARLEAAQISTTMLHDDAQRQAELRALLCALTDAHHGGLQHALQGRFYTSMNNQGERAFRSDIGEICQTLFPPQCAEAVTRIQQKVWGRQCLEILYDLLQVNDLLSRLGQPRREEKNAKGDLMRHIFCELHLSKCRSDLKPHVLVMMELLAKRLAFELVFLKSQHYMQRVQHAVAASGYPHASVLDYWSYD